VIDYKISNAYRNYDETNLKPLDCTLNLFAKYHQEQKRSLSNTAELIAKYLCSAQELIKSFTYPLSKLLFTRAFLLLSALHIQQYHTTEMV
jgi:hypothetical protein